MTAIGICAIITSVSIPILTVICIKITTSVVLLIIFL